MNIKKSDSVSIRLQDGIIEASVDAVKEIYND